MTQLPDPRIDYLARDYNSLRQLLLDRLALEIPNWTERHAADLEIVLVELLAYTGDYLSYYQDAVGAEAYLETARQRISLRRHARLLDYPLDEGLNARAYVHLAVDEDGLVVPAGTSLLTETSYESATVPSSTLNGYEGMVFETMHDVTLYRQGNLMRVEPDNAGDFALPPGATSAHLRGSVPHLRAGDLLLFHPSQPGSGSPVPGSLVSRHLVPRYGHTVRLTAAPELTINAASRPVTVVRWSGEDALPFAIPVTASRPDGSTSFDLCTVRSNLVLVDQGQTVQETLTPVAERGPFQPQLQSTGIAHGAPYNPLEALGVSAAASLIQNPRTAVALIALTEELALPGYPAGITAPPAVLPQRQWTSRRDLLLSSRFARDFVAEIDNDGHATLRFGDDRQGRRPAQGSTFRVRCRLGAGTSGNVGAGAIRHIVWPDQRILAVSNPLPATGGTDPELAGRILIDAPQAFQRVQRRCITEADYVRMASEYPGVERVVVERIWDLKRITPDQLPRPLHDSLQQDPAPVWAATVLITVVRAASPPTSSDLCRNLQTYLTSFARIGDFLLVVEPTPIEVGLYLQITVVPSFTAQDVRTSVDKLIAERVASTGYAFGQILYASTWAAAAAAVPGVRGAQASFYANPTGDTPDLNQQLLTIPVVPTSFGRITRQKVELG